MQKLFIKYISIIILISSFFILCMAWIVLGYNAERSAYHSMQQKLSQTYDTLRNNDEELKTLKESLNEDYLTRAYAFAYIIQENPSILNSQSELHKVKELLQTDELHVINEKGILYAGTIPKYFGMDFATTKQTAEFLSILKGERKYLVQEVQPNGAEAKIFQYIGVKCSNSNQIAQIGIAPTRLLNAQKRVEIPYILSRMPIEEGIDLFVINKDSEVIGHTNHTLLGKNAKQAGIGWDVAKKMTKGTSITINNTPKHGITKPYKDKLICITMKDTILYAGRNNQMIIITVCLFTIAGVTILVLNRFLKRNIIIGIQDLTKDLTRITNGNLDTHVQVNHNPEFTQISNAINKMVQSILNTTIRMANIIDVINVPIGIFEIRKNNVQVYASERIKQILCWNEQQAQTYFTNKDKFLQQLQDYRRCPEKDGAYQIQQAPPKWIQIYLQEDDESQFGIIYDVSDEMKKKDAIRYQRDHDHLTGLRTLSCFKKDVMQKVQESSNNSMMAMVMMDLDFFKSINDTYGHDFGDIYLCHFAKHLAAIENEHVLSARRSGDEFCLFLHAYQSKDEIRLVLIQLYESLAKDPLIFPNASSKPIRMSSGISWCNLEDGIDIWINQADKALYKSKRMHRGHFSEYMDPEPYE